MNTNAEHFLDTHFPEKKIEHCDWCVAGCQYFDDGVRHHKDCDHYKSKKQVFSKKAWSRLTKT